MLSGAVQRLKAPHIIKNWRSDTSMKYLINELWWIIDVLTIMHRYNTYIHHANHYCLQDSSGQMDKKCDIILLLEVLLVFYNPFQFPNETKQNFSANSSPLLWWWGLYIYSTMTICIPAERLLSEVSCHSLKNMPHWGEFSQQSVRPINRGYSLASAGKFESRTFGACH